MADFDDFLNFALDEGSRGQEDAAITQRRRGKLIFPKLMGHIRRPAWLILTSIAKFKVC
jgi:hypothetical protein